METSPFDFTTSRLERPVTIDGKSYILREASEEEARKFRSAAAKTARLNDGELVGVEGVGDMQSYLVSLCLFSEDKVTPVPIAVIRQWPTRIVRPMFDWIKEVSQLEEKPSREKMQKDLQRLQKELGVEEKND